MSGERTTDGAASSLVIVGPTASAKSAVAAEVARHLGDVDIVSVDSMCVYRGMDIGTAKPSAAVREEIPHHMLDIVDPHENFNVAWFARAARDAMERVGEQGRRALLVGGTGLYHRSVVDDLDIPGEFPEVRAELDAETDGAALYRRLVSLDGVAASRMEPTNRRRVLRALEVCIGSGRPFSSFGPGMEAYPPSRHVMVGLHVERDALSPRIAARWSEQMAAGFLDEVSTLWERAEPPGQTASQALGYRELRSHLLGDTTLEQAEVAALHRIRRFAVRQQRWFRRDPRIRWVDAPSTRSEIRTLAHRLAATVA